MVNQNLKPFKILIVDDQAIDITNINFIASQLGIEATLAFDGAEAWELASKHEYDLIILDWNMPVTPGWHFLKKLEEAAHSFMVPSTICKNIVLHTGEELYADEFSPHTYFQILDVWRKPMDLIQLLKEMKKIREKIGA